ncbi:GGDEF domain-containing protein [Rugamonas sp. DEMB1]|uniref:GGDEF domain-containing protein n=1 Tax=Rugamonas sp. DEMB1 TaxID=3039386 RepID=UPI00244C248B|nr:GGDEF domain-containing protein [Rugamonas sp. DEMB1]WGG52589.1 GGDEF domain-containing protein [Rugamonas sp. DEMB1]
MHVYQPKRRSSDNAWNRLAKHDSRRQTLLFGAVAGLILAMLYLPQLSPWHRMALLAMLAATATTLTLRTLGAHGLMQRQPAREPAPGAASADLAACRAMHGITAPGPAPALQLTLAPAPAGRADHGVDHGVSPGVELGVDSGAVTDPLTGSYRRQEGERLLAHMFGRARRFSAPLALVVFRLEHVRRINAMFGRASGDAVLADLARFATERLRGSDVLARWDDCSFALLLPGTSARQAAHVARMLQQGIEQSFFAGFGGMSCSVGIGASSRCRSAAELALQAERRAAEA